MSTDFTYAMYGLNLVLLTPVSEAIRASSRRSST
jgi:hypothetical protein